MALDVFYADAEEKFVKNTVLYGDSSKLYVDAAHTTEVDHDTALNACLKGALVCTATGTYEAVTKIVDASGTLTVSCGETTYTVGASE